MDQPAEQTRQAGVWYCTVSSGPHLRAAAETKLEEASRAMNQTIALIAVVVRDYDEAIDFYVEKLGFTLVEDVYQPEQDKRWVVVRPSGEGSTSLLLARASSAHQQTFIGNQSGGRVFLFLRTDDFWRDHAAMVAAGIRFTREPKQEVYGTVAVFEDLYGNLWDLVQFADGR